MVPLVCVWCAAGAGPGTVSSMRRTLLAVDGTNLIHRNYHARLSTDLRDAHGQPIWALDGVLRSLAKMIDEVRPTSLIVALDPEGGCPSRRAENPQYKGGRGAPDEPLIEQVARLRVMLDGLGLAGLSVPEWEADDVLASVATQASERGVHVVVASSDKDVHQLIGDDVVVRKLEGTTLDAAGLSARYGVEATRWVEYAALLGEGADNLPGVTGIGPAKAAALLAAYNDVEAAIADPAGAATVIGARAGASLVSLAERFRSNRRIGTLRRDLKLDVSRARLDRVDPEWLRLAGLAHGVEAAADRLARYVGAH